MNKNDKLERIDESFDEIKKLLKESINGLKAINIIKSKKEYCEKCLNYNKIDTIEKIYYENCIKCYDDLLECLI